MYGRLSAHCMLTRGPDGKPAMSFDYRLGPGLAPSTNALTLMEIVGLPIE